MTEMTPRSMLNAIHEGLEESALLTALGYDAAQGRPNCHALNDALERRGYGRPIDERESSNPQPYRAYPDEWIRSISAAVSGRPDAPLRDVIASLKRGAVDPAAA